MLKPHHAAWLLHHPDRTPEWLDGIIKQGFDIHHLDGNYHNNDPINLVLIERVDHMRLHGNEKYTIKSIDMRNCGTPKATAQEIYAHMEAVGDWEHIHTALPCRGRRVADKMKWAYTRARAWAKKENMPWPREWVLGFWEKSTQVCKRHRPETTGALPGVT
ncbi:hypothetical protein UFOVP28_22 [uncultured Caudovirales phage]|uniref:HNH nuclease n=1 Tax=uncultured Caudovirales phage TaxID=2100421 RepID=A0A6J5KK91_9CAUD|nr:hypothetical protein UFOVP28_22 [uncultured Caudovirales phage]